ncbi:MAG: DUF983 domain-containing protein [Ilumatobacter sp.]|uniref:DUF983 domain-containing protein n=1 Tax=Ilumatobacter sp. TaxID=1967498 RepID=UPI0032988327
MTRSSLARMLLRGAMRRCPWCGGRGAFFTSWFSKGPACRTCGLKWRRGDVGFELGAAAMAAVIVLGPLILALGVVLAFTWPEVRVVPMMVVFLAAGIVLPVVLYPMSYTMWQGVDLLMRPVEPEHFVLEHLERSGGAELDSGAVPDAD